mgnify:CR=1 FL=1
MKITVNIDCTPLEARQFVGLPDVEPIQKAMLAEMEKKMLREMENFSTEKIMSTWLSFAPQNAEWIRTMFSQFASMASGSGTK